MQIKVIIHELSHRTVNNDDVAVGPLACHEYFGVKTARMFNKASHNAENHAFFMRSFTSFA